MEMQMEASANTLPDSLLDRLQAAAHALEQAADRLAAAETTLRAQAATPPGRKTTATLLAKEGLAADPAALDTALSTLSLEQRIAVKAQLLRSGLLG